MSSSGPREEGKQATVMLSAQKEPIPVLSSLNTLFYGISTKPYY